MKSEYETPCDECGEEMTVFDDYSRSDGHENPNERPERICEMCKWKENFDIKRVKATLLYKGNLVTGDQLEWILDNFPKEVKELMYHRIEN